MLWVFLAISAHFFWAVENVATKYIVGKRVSNPYVFLILLTVLSGGIGILIFPFVNFFVPEWKILFLLALAGFLYFYAGLPYIKAMQIEEVSRINILWNLVPIFSLFFGYFIGDRLSALEILALVFLVSGGVTASIHSREKGFSFSKAFWLMMLSCLVYSFESVLFRYVALRIPFAIAFVWVAFFEVLSALSALFLSKIRFDFKEAIKNCGYSLLGITLGIAVIANLGIFLSQWALSLKPAALVFSFEGFQVVFVFIMAIFITHFYPRILKEEFDWKNIALKLTAMVLMIAGVVVLTFS